MMPDEHLRTAQALPDYLSPPLNEIAVGVQFEPLARWQTRHVGQYWTEVSKEFPVTEDQPPIFEVEPGPRFQILQLPPMRRTFLISADQNFVLQLQESRFLLNWRKRQDKDKYPRFDSFFKKFLDTWGGFSDFVSRERVGSLKPSKYEITYINYIEQSDAPLAVTAERYVKMINWAGVKAQFLSPPTGINSAWTFSLPDELGLGQANLNQGVKPDGRTVLVFAMSCTGVASPRVSLNEWFASAHRWLGRGFAELTTDAARRDWGYKE